MLREYNKLDDEDLVEGEGEVFAPRLRGPYLNSNIQEHTSTSTSTNTRLKPHPASPPKTVPPSKWMSHLPIVPRLILITILVVVMFLSVSSVPIWNKYLDKGYLPGASPFPYALTVSFLQLVGTDLILFCAVLVTGAVHLWQQSHSRRSSFHHTADNQPFYFTHRLWFKLFHTVPIGILFGFKLGLTNWGLHLAPTVNFHLLIQASSLFWVILFGFFIVREVPTVWALLCAAGATAGAILISLDFQDSLGLGDAKWWALGVNFASAIFEGLSIVFLRRARNILANSFPEECDVLLIIQITFLKLVISALTVLPFALLIEGWWDPLKEEILWKALPEASWLTLFPYMFVGSIFTVIFQSDYTALTFIGGAQDVGVLSHVKIVPQVALSEAVFQNFKPNWEKDLGLALVLLSGVTYAVLKWFHLTHYSKHHNFFNIFNKKTKAINAETTKEEQSLLIERT